MLAFERWLWLRFFNIVFTTAQFASQRSGSPRTPGVRSWPSLRTKGFLVIIVNNAIMSLSPEQLMVHRAQSGYTLCLMLNVVNNWMSTTLIFPLTFLSLNFSGLFYIFKSLCNVWNPLIKYLTPIYDRGNVIVLKMLRVPTRYTHCPGLRLVRLLLVWRSMFVFGLGEDLSNPTQGRPQKRADFYIIQ